MLVGVRAKVESADHWREQFKTHNELFTKQGVTCAHIGATEDNAVLAIFEISDLKVFTALFESSETVDSMANDRIIEGSVEMFVMDETFFP